MGPLNWGKRASAAFLLCAATAIGLQAQDFTTLFSFDGTDGANPFVGLVQATDGNLYGTTVGGGTNGNGTVFKITPNGTLTTLYSFCAQAGCTDGANPGATLIQARNGNFYGTTGDGGFYGFPCKTGCGTVFKITPSGTLTTLHIFDGWDGEYPGALVQTADGDFYGTAYQGGVNGVGTIFKITPGGTLTTLYSFCSQSGCPDGAGPYGGLVQATNGSFYGAASFGGGNDACPGGCGTVFKITLSGTLTTLYSFCTHSGCTDGGFPSAGLIQAIDGDLYGTTLYGGAGDACDISGAIGCGTVFEITPSGTLTTLHSFCSQSGCPDGDEPTAALVQAVDGNFYGTTGFGGDRGTCTRGCGTIFKITPSGTLTTLHSFDSTDGAHPYGALVQDTNGNFYGTAYSGVANGDGRVFSLSVGLGPFVETQRTSGKVGAAIKILGSNLTGATSVSFNGTAATFTVESGSLIGASVPEGATTGTVQVVTPSGTLSSNVPFRVLP